MHLCKDWICFKFLNYHVNYLVKYVLYMCNCIHERTIKSSCILYLKTLMVGHGGSSAGSYLANPASPIPFHCAVIILFKSVPVHQLL